MGHLAAPLVAEALEQQESTDGAPVRLLEEAVYQADSWPIPRRVVITAEALAKGPNTRFVVTTRPDAPSALTAGYASRGETENWIKDLTGACFGTRLSCHRCLANRVRLLLPGAASCLLDTLRRWLVRAGVERMHLATGRLRLIKIGGRIRQFPTHLHLRLASSHPGEPLWHLLAAHGARL